MFQITTCMRNGITKLLFFFVFFALSNSLFAQSNDSGASDIISYALLGVVALIVLGFVLNISDNLMAIEAKQTGADKTGANFSLFPRWNEIFKPKVSTAAAGEKVIALSKGHDILLEGEAEKVLDTNRKVSTFAVQPPNFIGMSPIPKVVPEIGTNVRAGDVILFDKKRPDIKYVSPVSGEVIELNRGAKRAIAEVVILADNDMQYKELDTFDLVNGSREDLVTYLLGTGAWPLIRQRPFNIVAEPNEVPRDIFISTFDTAPLAPDLNFVVEGQGIAFQKGLDVLTKLTPGKVYLGLDAREGKSPSTVFTGAAGVEKRWFHGAHPAGNVGVQIHHIKPIGSSDKVWTLDVQAVITLGKIFTERRFVADRIIAVAGAEVSEPQYVKTYLGAKISDILKDQVANEKVRFISGDPLSGEQKNLNGFLNAHDDQLTVIEEGDYYEPFGWLLPLSPRPSISGTFPDFLARNTAVAADTNTHGEKRAFVVTGQYEKVLPMDIYPQHLMKAILVNDFERMEGLGLVELVEEDIALAEFVCTSKQPLQKILRDGLNTMYEQG